MKRLATNTNEHRWIRELICVCLCFSVTACSVGPKYERPKVNLPSAFREPPPSGWQEAQPRDEVAKGEWWVIFDDPVLNRLEAQATQANGLLRAALARMQEARALVGVARADLYPSVRSDILPSTGRAAGNRVVQPNSSTVSYGYGSFSLPVDMSYEVDITKTIHYNVQAAQATAQAAAASYETVLLTLKADVARSYFMLRGIDTDRAVLKRNIEVQRKALDLAKRRHDGGLVSGLDVSQAETLLNSTTAEWVAEGRVRQQVEHFLAVLCGIPAPTFSLAEEFRDRHPPHIPEGMPADLLERRPDIAAAERTLAANNAKIGIARGAFFPTLQLTGNGGFLSRSIVTLLEGNSISLLFAPLLSVPIFQGGRPKANLEYSQKVYEESVAMYKVSFAVAMQEVEDALSDLRVLKEQGEAIDKVLASAHRTLDISTARYQQGLANYLEVLDAQRTVLANERQAAQTLGFRMIASVQLIKAIGGGWSDRPNLTANP